ncbi:MAG: hypothetical protein K0U74_08165 [Alphaproteobacteria bacterium]|nr:hypothetical protein [Alphaproteobacteria bacterium]
MASTYFSSYAKTLNRVYMAQLIDDNMCRQDKGRQRASLVVNPITGNHYSAEYATPAGHVHQSPTPRHIASYIPEGTTIWDYTPAE